MLIDRHRALGVGLPRPLAPRQGRALHPWRELHRLVLVERLRQGRADHLGDAGGRLPAHGPGPPRSRAARLPAGGVVLLVHVLAGAAEASAGPRRPARPLARGARERAGDPVGAWAQVAAGGAHKGERGRGGFVRASWDEVTQMIAAATVHTIKDHGPDRVAGFTPIPAMSPVSFAAGSRFLRLIGAGVSASTTGTRTCPPASPQVFGDQTDVPESADWWDASYLIIWGTNLPMTRTPDAHFMTEARYRGQKVVVVSPDYSDHVKFADDWLPAQPGTDGALAMAMGHVILSEFWVERRVAALRGVRAALHRSAAARHAARARRRLRARPLPDRRRPRRRRRARGVQDVRARRGTGRPAVPNGSVGFRWGEEGKGRWNLRLDGLEPVAVATRPPGCRGGRGRSAAL